MKYFSLDDWSWMTKF